VQSVLAKPGDVHQHAADVDDSDLNLRGLNVTHLKTAFVRAVVEAGPFLRHRCTENGGTFCGKQAVSCPAGCVEIHGKDAQIHEIEPLVIRGQGKDTICPRDGRKGAAYVDAVENGAAGRAQLMLSYTWGYTVASIVDSLVAYCEQRQLDEDNTFVWLCCLCLNQHRVREQREKGEVISTEDFQKEFETRVLGIKHVLSLTTPWNDPGNMKRAWW
jgi:hypothetical protein